MGDRQIEFRDPETDVLYTLTLNADDFIRFHTDTEFASSLLFHAKCTKSIAESNVDEINADPEYNENEIVDSQKTLTTWSYSQTMALINSVESHLEDFNHPRKRKNVFELVANDLVSSKVQVSAEAVRNKWKSLNRSYQKAKDIKNKTGRGPSRFNFFEKMDDILGNKPTNKCHHSINSSDTVITELGHENEYSDIDDSPLINNDQVLDTPTTSNPMKKRKVEGKLTTEYMKAKIEHFKNKQIRHEENMNLEKEKMKLEEKKLAVLELYLQHKSNDHNSQ